MTSPTDPLPPPSSGRRLVGPVRVAGWVATSLAVALLTAAGLRGLAESLTPGDSQLAVAHFSDKIAFWREHGEDFDTLLFGTSSVFRGIDPQRFDAASARAGLETRTFNASMPGLKFADLAFFLDRYLESAPSSLAWVIVEPNTRVYLYRENLTTERVLRVHDPANTASLVRLTWALPIGWRKQLGYGGNHLLAGSYRALGAGSLANVLRPHPTTTTSGDLAHNRGFVDIEQAYPLEVRERRTAFAMLQRGIRSGRIAAPGSVPPTDAHLPEVARRRFAEIAERVTRRARLAWVIMPHFGDSRSQEFRNSFRAGELPGILLDLEDPETSPGHLNPALYSDRTHLSPRGARVFSVRLGRSLAAVAHSGSR